MSGDKRKGYSAGILPFTIRNNQIYYLLGRDWRDEGWSDFGGKVEDKDSNSVIKTAIREFYEETMGSVMHEQELVQLFDNHRTNTTRVVRSVTLNGSPYYMHFVFIQDDEYSKYFNKIYNFLKYSKFEDARYFEKCEIKWVSANDMNKSNPELKLRNIFKRTLHRCQTNIQDIEKDALKEYALKR